jgi:hypothetical protein
MVGLTAASPPHSKPCYLVSQGHGSGQGRTPDTSGVSHTSGGLVESVAQDDYETQGLRPRRRSSRTSPLAETDGGGLCTLSQHCTVELSIWFC